MYEVKVSSPVVLFQVLFDVIRSTNSNNDIMYECICLTYLKLFLQPAWNVVFFALYNLKDC